MTSTRFRPDANNFKYESYTASKNFCLSPLSSTSKEELKQYELIADGIGIHWPVPDEDLSLKGFLQAEIRNVVRKDALT